MSNKVYTLKFTPKASEDLEDIYMYISSKLFAEIAANNLLEKIENSIVRLKSSRIHAFMLQMRFWRVRVTGRWLLRTILFFISLMKKISK